MDLTTILLVFFILVFGIFLGYFLGNKIAKIQRDKYWEGELQGHRKDAVLRSRAVLSGQFSEQLAPFFPDFNFKPTECKFLGSPVDFIVFNGADDKKIDEVVFVEVKSGKSKLSSTEKSLKETIENKNIRWEEYRIPENVTKSMEKDLKED
jgi:predicted Holliday junction resolvase-like endonuclease